MKKIYVKILTGLILTTFLTFFTMCNQAEQQPGNPETSDDKSGELMKRSDIDPKYTWDLTHLYKSDNDWELDYKLINSKISVLKTFEGKLGISPSKLYEAMSFVDKLWADFAKLSQYSSLAKDLDMSSSKYQSMFEKANNLGTEITAALSFFKPEIMSIPDAKIKKFVNSNKDLKIYSHKLDNLIRMKPHTLTKSEEEIMALAGPIDESFGSTYRLWSNADVVFPTIKDDNGNDFQLSHARFYSGMTSLNRDFRLNVYKNYYKPFMQFRNSLASNYYASIKSNIFQAKARKYRSTLEWSLDLANVPVEVYNNLINNVNQNLKPLQRWCSLKKKLLGIDKMHAYDTYVTLFPGSKRKYTIEEAKEIVLKAMKPLGEDYISNMKFAFDNRWIDVYETKGKRSGAYSSGTSKESHPYVLLNWNNELDDVFTLAHEMGHNMHSLYTGKTQPYPYADYPIFLAEVASITNEMLLLDYLIKNAQSKDEKLTLIEKYLNNISGTFYRQTRFAEFEMQVQKMTEDGEVLTADVLAKVFGDGFQKYWGEDMVTDEEEKNSWSRIPHFYYDYYVYSYATSFASAQVISENIKNHGQSAIDKHLAFLKSGDSEYPLPTLLKDGVDMASPEPIIAVAKKMDELLNQMEELLK